MQNSKIEWTHHTFNIVWGCLKVSPGCTNCYAETLAHRYGYNVWGPAKTTGRRTMSENYWRQPIRWNEQARQASERRRVFCGSMCDVFEDHPTNDRERERLWPLVEATPHLDWLLLTKRPENIDQMLPHRWGVADQGMPRNVWLGFSAEDQKRFDERWQIMEWVRRMWYPTVVFLSAEPLLGPLDVSDALTEIDLGDEEHQVWSSTLDWLIAGGESGHGARPMHPDWARSLRDQCAVADVPFFFKQYGEHIALDQAGDAGVKVSATDAMNANTIGGGFLRVGKHAAGRLLDGVEHNAYPA